MKSLKQSAKKKTIVLVSHRVSTMNVADVVYEMENGRSSEKSGRLDSFSGGAVDGVLSAISGTGCVSVQNHNRF